MLSTLLIAAAANLSGSSEASFATLPIREVTAFKDGHALVLRAGSADVQPGGDVVLTDMPRPIMGTFWADSTEPDARLAAVGVAEVVTDIERPAVTIDDLLRANVGRSVSFERQDAVLTGTLLRLIEVPSADDDGQPAQPVWTAHGWVTPQAPRPAGATPIALIQLEDGVAALPTNELRNVRFLGDGPETRLTEAQSQERMTLDLDWAGAPGPTADVSLMYVQRGLRWIPSYRITMVSEDRVLIELQATLVNELADLDDVTMHLAIGVPSFAFEHTPDPIALRESFDRLGFFFQRATDGQTGSMLSNAIMMQQMRSREIRSAGAAGATTGSGAPPAPSLAGGERAEDLYVFTVHDVSSTKGSRMVFPLVSYEATFASVYSLRLAAGPPLESRRQFNDQQQRELARLLDRPIARHVLRINNENERGYPITTAPAMVVKDGRTLAQGLLTYAAPGAEVDLEVGSAVDISVTLDERETERTPDAHREHNTRFSRIDIGFEAEIVNRKPHAVTLEVEKLAFGLPDAVGQGGDSVVVNMFGEDTMHFAGDHAWWRWYHWPYYWYRLNGATRFTWTVELEPGVSETIDASWHYFWN